MLILRTVFVMAARVLSVALNFLIAVYVARVVDHEQAGYFFTALAVATVGGRLACLGAVDPFMRRVSRDRFTPDDSLSSLYFSLLKRITAISFPIAVGLSFGCVLLAELELADKRFLSSLPYLPMCVVLFAFVQLTAAGIQGFGRAILATSVQTGFHATAFLLIGYLRHSMIGDAVSAAELTQNLMLGLVIATGLAVNFWRICIAAVWKERPGESIRKPLEERPTIDPADQGPSIDFQAPPTVERNVRLPPEFLTAMRSCWGVVAMEIAVQWSGFFAAATLLSPEDTGTFAAAHRVAMVISFSLISVNLLFAPKFVNAFESDGAAGVDRLSLRTGRLVACFAIPMTICICVFSPVILRAFGPEYVQGATALRAIALGHLVSSLCGSVGYILTMTGEERRLRNAVVVSGPISILIAWPLVFYFGLLGAGIATGVSIALQNIFAAWTVRDCFGFNPINLLRRAS